MRRDFPTTEAGEPLEAVVNRMHESGFDTLPVFEKGHLIALLTRENIAEYLMIHTAISTASKRPGGMAERKDRAAEAIPA